MQLYSIILSYHLFGTEENNYPFSRTYEQFINDLDTKVFDLITIDDARPCQIEACRIMMGRNIRAKLFVSTALIGTDGYCTWEQLKELSNYHDIENHSHQHKYLTDLDEESINWNIHQANKQILLNIQKKPRYFVAPWNQYNDMVDRAVKDNGLISLKGRINIKNITS